MERKTAILAGVVTCENDGRLIMSILAEFDTPVNNYKQRTVPPSVKKYGALVCEDGFIQFPNLVKDFLHNLGLCSTAILLVIELIGYRRQPDQEIFPSVETLRKSLKLKSSRRVNQLTAQLVELGLLIKIERFAKRSQISNSYDLEPLFRRVAAWHSAKTATDLAEQEAADEPFEPQSVLEEAAQIISEEFGEPEAQKQRYNAQRLARRQEQNSHIEWESFTDVVERAVEQTEKRAKEQTRTGKAFTKLIPYFFSALDYHLSKVKPAPVPVQQKPITHPQAAQNKEQQPQPRPAHQQPKKSGVLAERAQERKAAETAGRAKVHAPEMLKCRIEATALTFREKNVKSAVQRAANLMHDAQLEESHMCELVDQARAATSRATGVKNRMSYFFAVLEEMLVKCCTNVDNTI